MAATVDVSGIATALTTTTTDKVPLTFSALSNLCLAFVCDAGGISVTGVTVGGNAMTILPGSDTGGFNGQAKGWYYLSPPTGAQDVIATYGSANRQVILTALSVIGVDQVNPFGTVAVTQGTATALMLNPVAVEGDLAVSILSVSSSATVSAYSSASTELQNGGNLSGNHLRQVLSAAAGPNRNMGYSGITTGTIFGTTEIAVAVRSAVPPARPNAANIAAFVEMRAR